MSAPAPEAPSWGTQDEDVLLDVKGLKRHFPVNRGAILRRQVAAVKAVDGLDFSVKRGETLGLVGSPAVARPPPGGC